MSDFNFDLRSGTVLDRLHLLVLKARDRRPELDMDGLRDTMRDLGAALDDHFQRHVKAARKAGTESELFATTFEASDVRSDLGNLGHYTKGSVDLSGELKALENALYVLAPRRLAAPRAPAVPRGGRAGRARTAALADLAAQAGPGHARGWSAGGIGPALAFARKTLDGRVGGDFESTYRWRALCEMDMVANGFGKDITQYLPCARATLRWAANRCAEVLGRPAPARETTRPARLHKRTYTGPWRGHL